MKLNDLLEYVTKALNQIELGHERIVACDKLINLVNKTRVYSFDINDGPLSIGDGRDRA